MWVRKTAVLRRNAEGAKIFGKSAEFRPHAVAGAEVNECPFSGKLEQKGIDRDVQIVAGRAGKSRGFSPIHAENYVERGREPPIAQRGQLDVADLLGLRDHAGLAGLGRQRPSGWK